MIRTITVTTLISTGALAVNRAITEMEVKETVMAVVAVVVLM
jgi:hypothetical protein